MVVFYSKWWDGTYQFSFIGRYLSNLISPDDTSYWMVPLSVDDMWEIED